MGDIESDKLPDCSLLPARMTSSQFPPKPITMFGLFKNSQEKLEAKYQQLMQEAYQLSHSDRKKSDQKYAEAAEIQQKIDELKAAKG